MPDIGRPSWMPWLVKDIKEDSIFDDAYDREKWRGFMMAAMTVDGPTS